MSTAPLTLRLATRRDIPQLALIASQAFIEDVLFAHLSPKRHEYPDDFLRGFATRFQLRLLESKTEIVVAVADGGKEIAGYAVWERAGEGWDYADWMKDTEHSLTTLTSSLSSRIYPNRAADASASAKFSAVYTRDTQRLWGNQKRWHLAMLGVSPNWQRKGVGGILVKDGMRKAQRDKVIAVLESSPAGRGLYARCGWTATEPIVKIEGMEDVEGPGFWWDGRGELEEIL